MTMMTMMTTTTTNSYIFIEYNIMSRYYVYYTWFIQEDHNAGAWMLLAECAGYVPKFDTKVPIDYWQTLATHSYDNDDLMTYERVLVVLGHIAEQLQTEQADMVIGDLQTRLLKFNSPPELIAIIVNTLFKLYTANGGDKHEGRRTMTEWCTQLLKHSDKYLSSVILCENQDTAIDEARLVCHLFTIGHIGHLCPNAVPTHVFMLVQSLIAGPGVYVHNRSNSGQTDSTAATITMCSQSSKTASSQSSEPDGHKSGHDGTQRPDSRLSDRPDSQMSMASTQVLTQFSGSKMSTKIRAHAFITLGKLCLQNENVAKKCVAAMVRELDTSPDPVIRNNVMIILCDLCVRYTTLTDRYVGQISNCIRDDSPLVRKQTLTCIISLLQEDYMKWRGTLLFKFLTALVDENETIGQFAEFCFVHLLLHRHPGLFFQHFAESIFYFNSYESHPVYNKYTMNDKEKSGFSLKGPENKEKRMKIYKFMLDNMTDAHRFNLMAKLAQDVLGSFTDQQMSLDAESQPILNDTLTILCSKELKVSALRGRSGEDDADIETDAAAAAVNAAKKNLVTQVVKKNVIENIVPLVINLKHMLEAERSPLLKDLMIYLRDLMKEYKNEIKDILAADKQLASEIEFDLRRFEDETERENNPPVPRQPAQFAAMIATPRAPGATPRATGVNARVPGATPRTPHTPRGPAVSLTQPAPDNRAPTTPAASSVNTPPSNAEDGRRTPNPVSNPPEQLSTPPRNKRLDIANLVNSAKKALSANARKTPGQKRVTIESPLVRSTSPNNLNNAQNEAGAILSENDDVTPETVRRAISTPDRTIVDITFRADNMSMIAPSPISPPVSRITRRTGRNASGKARGGGHPLAPIQEQSNSNHPIIMLKSPEQPAAEPRHWKVKLKPVTLLPPANDTDSDDDDITTGRTNSDVSKRTGNRDVITSRGSEDCMEASSDENRNPNSVLKKKDGGKKKTTSSGKESDSVLNESSVRRSSRTRKS